MIDYSEEDSKRFEQNDAILPKLLRAKDNGDHELAAELRKKMIYPAEALLGFRDCRGPEAIIELGLNDSECVRLYGKDWLYDESI